MSGVAIEAVRSEQFGEAFSLANGLAYGMRDGFIIGLAFGLRSVLRAEKPDPATMVGPARLYLQDRRTFLAMFLIVGLVYGLFSGLTTGVEEGFASDFTSGLPKGVMSGLALGLTGGLVYGLTEAIAWAGFAATTSYLALRHHQVPWNLMAFLQDAHEKRGVLRQVGAVYQFRHLDLQRHLARTPAPPGMRPNGPNPEGRHLAFRSSRP